MGLIKATIKRNYWHPFLTETARELICRAINSGAVTTDDLYQMFIEWLDMAGGEKRAICDNSEIMEEFAEHFQNLNSFEQNFKELKIYSKNRQQ